MATDEAPERIAVSVLDQARAGDFERVTERFAPSLRALVPAEALRGAWAAQTRPLGAVVSVGTPVSEPATPGVVRVRVPVTAEHGAFTLIAQVADGGWLAGLEIAPAAAAEPVQPWQAPAYADPASFTEQEVTVGAGPRAVPGTLTRPRTPGPHPAVVLLSGSGPNDRDETIGRNKPFKDLAWGLATQGLAVLRYDKVTVAHPAEVAGDPGFTVADEYVTDAVAAVGLLGRHEAADPSRIFVLGHSLGGTVAPRVAAAEPSVAGLVILAGTAQRLDRAGVRQFRYLARLGPEPDPASQAAAEVLARQAALVDSPELSPDTPASELPFGVPAAYWLDLRAYDPVATAAQLTRPMLFVQGGRDYQVTIPDDMDRWRAGLDGRADVTFRVFDRDNHLFFTGTGPSSPAEYEPAQHVDPAVVGTIADWITAAPRRA
ncbi:MAG TPA: alpha/beta fold hydrolase [Streptosporangiaceae bacterium]